MTRKINLHSQKKSMKNSLGQLKKGRHKFIIRIVTKKVALNVMEKEKLLTAN